MPGPLKVSEKTGTCDTQLSKNYHIHQRPEILTTRPWAGWVDVEPIQRTERSVILVSQSRPELELCLRHKAPSTSEIMASRSCCWAPEGVMGWTVPPPPIHTLKSEPPVIQNVILLVHKVFTEAIKLNEGIRVDLNSNMTGVLIRRKHFVHRYI